MNLGCHVSRLPFKPLKSFVSRKTRQPWSKNAKFIFKLIFGSRPCRVSRLPQKKNKVSPNTRNCTVPNFSTIWSKFLKQRNYFYLLNGGTTVTQVTFLELLFYKHFLDAKIISNHGNNHSSSYIFGAPHLYEQCSDAKEFMVNMVLG